MAKTIKHRADGSYYEQGDTQGLMLPTPCDYASTTFQAYTSPAGLWKIPPLNNQIVGTGILQNSFKENKYFQAPVTGVYNFSVNIPPFSSAVDHVLLVISKYYTDTQYGSVLSMVDLNSDTLQSGAGSTNATVRLNAGEKVAVYIFFWNAFNCSAGDGFRVTLLQVSSPYIIANKGALVSGGAFQFDANGKGYTKNYFTLNQEVRVGTYLDGKPVYQKSVQCTTASGTITIIGAQTDILPNIKEMVTSEIREIRGTQLTQSIIGSVSAEFGANVRITFPSSWGAGYVLTVTLWYTKTTD
jgi:hypothetical protein